jgi:hypothetical protein
MAPCDKNLCAPIISAAMINNNMRFTEYYNMIDLTNPRLFGSQTLFKEMAVMNPNTIEKATKAMQFIHDNKIHGAIIGGVAVSNYTEDRPLTPDIDFMTSDLELVKKILDEKNIPYRPLALTGSFGIAVPSMDLDFLDASNGNENEVAMNSYIIQTAKNETIGGQQFPMIDPAVLTIQKFTIGREKDTKDAFKLLPIVSKEEIKKHLKKLKPFIDPDELSSIWTMAKSMAF